MSTKDAFCLPFSLSAATQNLLGVAPIPASLEMALDIDLSKVDLGVPIVLDIDLAVLELEAQALGWRSGDELHRKAYEMVRDEGLVWREACTRAGVDYSTAQHRYRLRGLPSPIRTFPVPAFGTREETAQRVYDLVLHGHPVSSVAPRHGISRQYFWSWCKQSQLPNPSSALRAAKAGIAAFAAV